MWFYAVDGTPLGPVTVEQLVVVLVGVAMLMGCALAASTHAGPSVVATAFALLVQLAIFGMWIAMVLTVYRLMSLLGYGVPVIWAIATLLPIAGLLTLLVISLKTQAWCRKRSIYVGSWVRPRKASCGHVEAESTPSARPPGAGDSVGR